MIGATVLAVRGYLLVRTPNRPTRQVSIVDVPFTIGRDRRNDLVLDDEMVSRQHALIDDMDGQLQVADIGSRNGSALNGSTLRFPTALEPGDMMQMGQCSLWFSLDPPTPGPSTDMTGLDEDSVDLR